MDKIKEFFQSPSKPADETQTGDKPGIGHQRVDSTQTPADIKSPDETAQAPEDKTADQPSGEAEQGLQDTGLTGTQSDPLQASADQPGQDEAQNTASENPPPLEPQGEGEQRDNVAPDQEHGDPSKLREDDPAAQDVQAEADVSKASTAVEPDQEHGDPTKLREDDPAAQDSQAGLDGPSTSTAQPDEVHGDPSKLREDDPAAQGTLAGTDESTANTVEPDSAHGDPSKLREDDPAAQDTQTEPNVSATQPGEEPAQLGGSNDAAQGGVALDDSKPDEPSGQGLSEDNPQGSFGEGQPQAEAGGEQPTTSVADGGLNEDVQAGSANNDAAVAGLSETKEAGHHEIQPDTLEASQEGHPSIDEAQKKAEENAPDVGQVGDQAPVGGASESRDEVGVDAPANVEQPSEAKDDSGPAAQEVAGGSLAASDGLGNDASRDDDQLPAHSQQESDLTAQDTSGDNLTSIDKPADDVPRQDEQLPSTADTGAQDPDLPQPEPGLSAEPESSQTAGNDAGDKAQENVPDIPSEDQPPLASESQGLPAADEPKEDQSQSRLGSSGVDVGDSQLDTPGGDSKPVDVPETQQESLVDAGGPPQGIDRDESAPAEQPKETPGAGSVAADQKEEHVDEDGEDTGDAGKKPKLTERLKEKVKEVVHKD